MSNTTKKEVEYTPLYSTSMTPKRASIRHRQLYQITNRNFKRLNIFKNITIGIMAALIMQLTIELALNTWYQVVAFYVGTVLLVSCLLAELDKFINYMAGGSYE